MERAFRCGIVRTRGTLSIRKSPAKPKFHILVADTFLIVAKVFGKPGRYVSDQVGEKRIRMLLVALISIAFVSATGGFLLCMSIYAKRVPHLIGIITTVSVLASVAFVYRWSGKQMDELEKGRLKMQRGASGENSIADALSRFPTEFFVIHDLTTAFGNLDHVVIGPTGVFVIDTKNWRGLVSSDGKGELLLNGHSTDKPLVRQFVARMMGIRDKIRVLVPHVDAYYHALFVFTAARVDARWGTTSSVNCIRDDQLFDYIVERNFGKRLNTKQVEEIGNAFLTLARLDSDFAEQATTSSRILSSARANSPIGV